MNPLNRRTFFGIVSGFIGGIGLWLKGSPQNKPHETLARLEADVDYQLARLRAAFNDLDGEHYGDAAVSYKRAVEKFNAELREQNLTYAQYQGWA